MSSILYSRYIPPKYIKLTLQHENSSTLEASEASRSSTQNTPHEPTSFRPDSPQQTSTQTTPSSPSKLLKRKSKNDDHLLDDQLQRPKRNKGHKFLLLKRDKSAKKAEKLAETTPTELEEMTALETRTALGETTALEDRIALDEATDFHPLEPLPQPKRISTDPFKTTDHPLPEWLRSPIRVSATTTAQFTELGIPIAASKILESRGFPYAFAVQVGLLQLLADGNREQRGDVLVSAPTGSGKTLGYVLPMMLEMSKMSAPRLRAIIVVPTRELAYQVGAVCNMAASIFSGKGRRKVQYEVASGYRGYKNEIFDMMDAKIVYNPVEYESRRLRQVNNWDLLGYETQNGSQPCCKNLSISSRPGHIVNYTFKGDMLICTPGRLIQHLLQTDGFDLSFVNWLVIDEADRLFAQSYQNFLKLVMASLARGGERQVTKVILSATLKKEVGQLTALKLKKPRLVVLEGADCALTTTARDADVKPNAVCLLPDKLIEVGIRVKSVHEKVLQLLTMLRDIRDGHPRLGKGSVLVFTKTNEATARLSRLISLLEPTTTVGTVTSMIPVSTRRKIIQNFDSENFSVLVASDIASRGLDLPGLRYVINYDMPANLETYVHRVGRTARAGKEGIAFTLFTTQFEGSRWKEISWNISLNQADGMRCVETESAVPTYEKDFMERYEAALKTLAKEACRA